MDGLRAGRPGRALLANAITERHDSIKRLSHKEIEVLGGILTHICAKSCYCTNSQWMNLRCWPATCTERVHLSLAQVTRQGLCHLGTSAVASAEEKYTRRRTGKPPVGSLCWADLRTKCRVEVRRCFHVEGVKLFEIKAVVEGPFICGASPLVYQSFLT